MCKPELLERRVEREKFIGVIRGRGDRV